ncbi:MAG: hypothetical protein KAV83_02855 [Desulfobacterales bacterium]|nr:hypothetical protein [Desulfobacterales bacterium]
MSIKSALANVTQDHVRTGRAASFAFDVPSIGTITCTRVFRAIRGKRIVCLGEIGGNEVVVKLYFDPRRAKIHWQRSDRGCRVFVECSLTAPKILFSGYLSEHDLYVMVFEYIENAVRFDTALADAPDEAQRQQLLDQLMACLARQHEQGIVQNDVHMGNFLLQGKEIYSLDGDQVRIYLHPLSKRPSLANLAAFLSYFSPIHDAAIAEHYQAYCSVRGWHVTGGDTQKLIGIVKRMRKRHLATYMRKIFRSRDPFLVCKAPDYFSVRDRRVWNDEFTLVCENPERFISDTNGQQLDSNHCCHLSIDAVPITLYSVRVFGNRLFRRHGIISRRWRNALRLNRLGIHTPRPIALIEKRENSRIWRAFLIVKSCDGILARDFFASDSVSDDDKDSVTERIAKVFLAMKQTGIAVRGVHSTNILISDLEPIFLDVVQLNQAAFFSRSSVAKGVLEFLQGWDNDSDVNMLFRKKFKQLNLI